MWEATKNAGVGLAADVMGLIPGLGGVSKGAKVIFACRNEEKTRNIFNEINQESSKKSLMGSSKNNLVVKHYGWTK